MNSGVNWDGVSHQEMYDKINGGAGVSSLSTASGAWASLSQVLRAADFSVRRISEQAAANWKGEGSESLQSATSPFADWADLADSYARSTDTQSVAQSEFFTSARGNIAPPNTSPKPTDSFVEKAASHLPGVTTDLEAREAADREAQKQAAEAMKTYDSSTYSEVQQQYFSAPPTIAVSSMPPPAVTPPQTVQPPPGSVGQPPPPASVQPPGSIQSPPGAVAYYPPTPGGGDSGPNGSSHAGSPQTGSQQYGQQVPGVETSVGGASAGQPSTQQPMAPAAGYQPGSGPAAGEQNVRPAGYSPGTAAGANAVPGEDGIFGTSGRNQRTGSDRQYGGAGAAAAAGGAPGMMFGGAGGGDQAYSRGPGSSGSTGFRNAGGIGSSALPGGGSSGGSGSGAGGGARGGSGAGGSGSGGSGPGSSGSGGSGSGGPGESAGGRSGVGPGTTTATPGAVAGQRTPAGARGGVGAGGMPMGGGGRGKGEDDEEHYSPEFLKVEKPFDDDRMVSPPVIGDERR